jgi:hypothetical protein
MFGDTRIHLTHNGKDAMKRAGLTHAEPTAARAEISGMDFSGGRDHKPYRLGSMDARFSVVVILMALLSGCSSESGKPAESAPPAPKPAELITARSAFQKMYVAARGWNQDAQPYRLEAIVTSDGNGHDGKWAEWRTSFASPAMRLERSYTWSGSAANGAPERGVTPGAEDGYSPTNASTQIFDMLFLKVDSDQAFATAQQHGGDKILEKEPDTPVFYVCEWNRSKILVWHVIYGASRETAKLTVEVNASTGDFIRVEK